MVVNQNNPGEDKETVRKVQVIFGNLWKLEDLVAFTKSCA
jgi:hypothetical protein